MAVRDGKVVQWKEFELPGFEGWFTHALRVCKGKFLEIRFTVNFRSDIVGTDRASRWHRTRHLTCPPGIVLRLIRSHHYLEKNRSAAVKLENVSVEEIAS